MPSPFPGMNAYLEQPSVWHDFHESFMPVAREVLSAQVLPRYFVKIDERLYIHELGDESRRLVGRGDLSVAALAPARGMAVGGTQTMAAPAEVAAAHIDTESVSYLEVRDRKTHQVVTVAELLSPSNKQPGPDREQYLAKARQVMRSNVHLVEIDLLRGGPRMPWLDMRVVVSRAEQRPKAGTLADSAAGDSGAA